MFRKLIGFFVLVLAVLSFAAQKSSAVPILQIYLEGATYDHDTETWVLNWSVNDPQPQIRLWVVGNVAGPGGQGTIEDVRLAVAYAAGEEALLNLGIVGSTTGGYGGYTDPSVASDPTLLQTVTDGSRPQLYGGSFLPGHDIYGPGTNWREYELGDMNLTDSQIADFT
jgi:hypothetical protein